MQDGLTATGATSQDHGKAFERIIRDSGRFPEAVGSRASNSDALDIEPRYDVVLDLHTSVTTTGDGWIGLADAIRFYEIDRPFRVIVGPWSQEDAGSKLFPCVHEAIVTTPTLRRLHGRLTVADIREMHAEYASFPAGPDGKAAASRAADRMLRAAAPSRGLVRLDFKGDDRSQRRLQLSIKLEALINAVRDDPTYLYRGMTVPTYVLSRGWYHSVPLPLRIASPGRRFRDPETSPQMSLGLDPPAGTPGLDVSSRSRPLRRQDDALRDVAAAAADPAQRRLIA